MSCGKVYPAIYNVGIITGSTDETLHIETVKATHKLPSKIIEDPRSAFDGEALLVVVCVIGGGGGGNGGGCPIKSIP